MPFNYLCKKLFNYDFEIVEKERLNILRMNFQYWTFSCGQKLLGITLNMEINDDKMDNRLTIFMYTHAGFLDAMMTGKIF